MTERRVGRWVKVLGFIVANGVVSLLINVGGFNINEVLSFRCWMDKLTFNQPYFSIKQSKS